MPVIPEMDEFVNWDNADPSVGLDLDLDAGLNLASPTPGVMGASDPNHNMNLTFENVDGDEFSFLALQHYDASHLPEAVDPSLTQDHDLSEWWETPEAPCAHCQRGGYLCKRIREGKFKGYCTSCVALRCQCSLGPSLTRGPTESATFPVNPWPTFGDHPDAIPQEDGHDKLHSSSAPDLAGLTSLAENTTVVDGLQPSPTTATTAKVGARFSRESVKILKNWLSTHNRHPYPTEEEKETLQRQTGLNKTQITNWLANARRRGKIQPPRSTSPHVGSWRTPIDIPQRKGTPAFENMNPLQRWEHSPPENEPASVTAIARAVTASASTLSSGLNSPYSFNCTDDGSNKSQFNGSSASSIGTSQSSGNSFASAFSHASRGSFGSLGSSFKRGRRRRRRRTAPKRPEEGGTALAAPLKTFQCTFCTETFRTKHDWQRHEKSLHLSLERWVCAPDGPKALNPDNNQLCCVFCGEANPDDAHVESHNHSACQERTLEERTFYRKDHLRQHLKLVHNVKFIGWSMDPWKVATPEIRSRCGFCGIVMDSWTIRVDHLAEHFKTGNTMADWKGDWGFEPPVLDMVENSIPPYLIHDERNSPLPYTATGASPESPRNAFELIKSELAYYMANQREITNQTPSDEELQREACRIIFGSEVLSKQPLSSTPSWLRDLIMSSEAICLQAQLQPIRNATDSRMARLKINGKDNPFEECPMERQLHEYVIARGLLGLTAMDSELQVEACNIIGRMEESSSTPSDEVSNFLLRLIYGSTTWLANFRQRAHLPRSGDVAVEHQRSKDPSTIDSTIHNYSRLETELAEFVKNQRGLGIEPNDADLQRQARIIIYEFDDGWNQTAADNTDWLSAFKQRHLLSPGPFAAPVTGPSILTLAPTQEAILASAPMPPATTEAIANPLLSSGTPSFSSPSSGGQKEVASPVKTGPFFINDANCYRRLARELARYVASTMSPNNPNCHVPSDEELQHQARWILYDDDDPWNQTAADNAEWLRRFKRDAGIITDHGSGLPEGNAWSIEQGGTGFAPPYAFPKAQIAPLHDGVAITLLDGAKTFEANPSTANKYLLNFTSRMAPPATVFCSRELEKGLVDFVREDVAKAGGMFPTDEAIRARARDILHTETTAADDQVLLEKFKAMMGEQLKTGTGDVVMGMAGESPEQQAQVQTGAVDATMTDMDMNITDSELNDILQDMTFEFGPVGELAEESGGGSGLLG